ncbi:MAG TPA: DNA polymerase, partial [Sphingobacteriaceae bacterium]
MKKLFLLDAMALVYRAHFALSKSPRFTSSGLNTSAIMGFTNTLLEVIRKEKPSHIAVVFDTEAPTERHNDFTDYKAHRQAMPEDLSRAIPYVVRLVEGFGIPVITSDGYEADDIIGTLAKKAEKVGFQVYCMTPDKDFAQLVSENIFIYKPARMGNDMEILGVKEVLKKWEVERVDQVIDILGLWGDAVDNIPGIPGVGEKTAKTLIKQYGSVENILAHSHELKGKLKENVENFSEQALVSKKLATIMLHAPVELDEEHLKLEEPSREILEPLFAELEFRTLGRRVFGEGFNVSEVKAATSSQMDLFGNPVEPAKVEAPPSVEVHMGRNINNTPHNYILADTPEKRKELIATLSKEPWFCFDTETTCMDANDCEMVGLAFSIKAGEAWYVPTSANQEECQSCINEFKALFENPQIGKIGQNLKYDLLVLKWYGIELKGELFDTMLAHYLLDPDSRHNMDLLAERFLGYTPVTIDSLIGKGKNQGNMRDVELEKIKEYAAEDADITLQLKEVFEPMLESVNAGALAREMENPLIYVLTDMEKEGVRIDKQALAEFSEQMRVEILGLEKTIYEKAGVKFNIASPKQLGEVLFDKLQLDPKAKKTKTGQYQTGEDVLLALSSKSDIV